MATSAISPLSAYRHLLRATRIAFEGDIPTLLAARTEARKQFDQNRRSGVDTPMKLQHAVETTQILRTNIVQGVRSGSTAEDGKGEGSYTLRIHDEIERGDNDTIKVAGEKDPVKAKPCSS